MLGYPQRAITDGPLHVNGANSTAAGAGAPFEEATWTILDYIAWGSRAHTGAAIVNGILARGASSPGLRTRVVFHAPFGNALTFAASDFAGSPVAAGGHVLHHAGPGSRARIEWNPGEWPPVPAVEPTGPPQMLDRNGPPAPPVRGERRLLLRPGEAPPGRRADEILLHELVHALMIMSGTSSLRGVQDFDIVDDVFAVMLTNMYSVEIGRPARRDHHGFQVLGRTGSEVRRHSVLGRLIADLATVLPDFAADLAGVDSEFNVFAE